MYLKSQFVSIQVLCNCSFPIIPNNLLSLSLIGPQYSNNCWNLSITLRDWLLLLASLTIISFCCCLRSVFVFRHEPSQTWKLKNWIMFHCFHLSWLAELFLTIYGFLLYELQTFTQKREFQICTGNSSDLAFKAKVVSAGKIYHHKNHLI